MDNDNPNPVSYTNTKGLAVIYFGIAIIVCYSIYKTLEFYGVPVYDYMVYIIFWLFLAICTIVFQS